MPNKHVEERLKGALDSLNATYRSTSGFASASIGAARSDFVKNFMRLCIPPAYRIEVSGQITDVSGNISGELDIILENTFYPTLPVLGSESGRLHFSEGVGAVLEVKSDLAGQWHEAIRTAQKLRSIKRCYMAGNFGNYSSGTLITKLPVVFQDADDLPIIKNEKMEERIPFIIVGYRGWSKLETIEEKLLDNMNFIDGILQIDPPMFVSMPHIGGKAVKGWPALLAFIYALHQSISFVKNADADLMAYAR